jgi:hypothetical protein
MKMKVEVLGVGCPKCIKMFEAAKEAAAMSGQTVSLFYLRSLLPAN